MLEHIKVLVVQQFFERRRRPGQKGAVKVVMQELMAEYSIAAPSTIYRWTKKFSCKLKDV